MDNPFATFLTQHKSCVHTAKIRGCSPTNVCVARHVCVRAHAQTEHAHARFPMKEE